MMTSDEKVMENRLRRIANRRGFVLTKNRSRDPLAVGYGTYKLFDKSRAMPWVLTAAILQEVAEYLK